MAEHLKDDLPPQVVQVGGSHASRWFRRTRRPRRRGDRKRRASCRRAGGARRRNVVRAQRTRAADGGHARRADARARCRAAAAPDPADGNPPPEVRAPVLDVAAPAPTAISAVLPAESSPAVGPPVAPAETAPMAIDASALTCTRRTPPEYPPQSRRLREEGAVQVQMELDADGRVISAVVIHGSGHSRLDAAAIEAVRQWHCQPARRSGTAVSAVAIQTFEFRLQRR